MKYFIFFCIMTSQIHAQNFLLGKSNGLLMISNFGLNEEIVLDTLKHDELVGYNWEGDSIVVFLRNQQFINSRKFKIENKIYSNLKYKQFFEINNFKALYFHSPTNAKTTYFYKNVKIIIANGMRITCLVNDQEKWSKSISKKVFGGIGSSGFGYQNPIISNDAKKILVSYIEPKFLIKSKRVVLEIDLESGKILRSIKNASNYAYSGDSNHILYFDSNKNLYTVISINEEKTNILYYWENCFWLLK